MNEPEQLETLLNDFDAGVFAQKIDRALSDVALGVAMTGKKGQVTITLDLKRIGESSQVEVNHTLAFVKPTAKGKASEVNTTSTPLYVGQGGKLSLMPHHQPSLFASPEGDRVEGPSRTAS